MRALRNAAIGAALLLILAGVWFWAMLPPHIR